MTFVFTFNWIKFTINLNKVKVSDKIRLSLITQKTFVYTVWSSYFTDKIYNRLFMYSLWRNKTGSSIRHFVLRISRWISVLPTYDWTLNSEYFQSQTEQNYTKVCVFPISTHFIVWLCSLFSNASINKDGSPSVSGTKLWRDCRFCYNIYSESYLKKKNI